MSLSLANFAPRIVTPEVSDADPLIIVTHNICNGALDAYDPLVGYYSERPDIDVLCFQEANEWLKDDQALLKDFAAKTGFDHYRFCDTNTDAKIVTLSRWPIIDEEVHTENFFHGVLLSIVQVGNRRIGVWNTHFNPYNEDARLIEAQHLAILREVHKRKMQEIGEEVVYIWTMDANSPSRADRLPRREIRKLNDEGNFRYGDGGFDYRSSDFLDSVGFIDAAVVRRATRKTLPARTDIEEHPAHLRLDKVYVPPALKKAVKRVKVLRNRTTKKISDHYPLEVKLLISSSRPKLSAIVSSVHDNLLHLSARRNRQQQRRPIFGMVRHTAD